MSNSVPKISLKKTKSKFEKLQIITIESAYEYCKNFYFDDIELYESFFLLLLNQGNYTIGFVKISQGGISGTVVDPVLVAEYAIESLSKKVILCHNHPSGNLKPSSSDIEITKKIASGLKLFDISVVDHLIITSENKYFSMMENGLI
jgi:DNA repair protein RadC